jgi:hypothetical protein
MSRLRLVYITSLVILGVLMVSTILPPLATGSKYSEVQREQLLQTENGYIIQFDIVNHEGEDRQYTVRVSFDSYQYAEDVSIPDGSGFTYVHHVFTDRMTEGDVSLAVYKEGEIFPFEQAIYHLK